MMTEMLHVADVVAREKNIDREEVLDAMEQALVKLGKAKYGPELDIRAKIDRKSGSMQLFRATTVVEAVDPELASQQVSLKEALKVEKDAKVGDVWMEELPSVEFGRIGAQSAKQVIVQKVRDAERSRQFAEYKDRVNEVINGSVKRVEYGNVTVDLGRAEGFLRRDELLPREHYKVGDRIRAFIYDVRQEQRGPQIFLSRTHPMFMAKLFAQEVPEIYDGIIEIKAVARDPGSRAKIAVLSHDSSIDPIGACVGMRGSRVQAVVQELQGEKIDIIPWAGDPATFVVNALAPAEVSKVVLDDEGNRMDVVVPDEQLSLAIGRRGQNVRLASMLTGWDIDIMTEAEESERRTREFNERTALFREALDVDEVLAQLLVTEGFTQVEELAASSVEDVAAIEGLDDGIAAELVSRADAWLKDQAAKADAKRKELGVDDAVAALPGLKPTQIVVLGEKGLKTLDDVADLAGDELIEMLGAGSMSLEQANAVIMAARAHWFSDNAGSKPGAVA